MSSAQKLKEAAFFIELLHALEERGEPLTHADDSCAEASYLYGAILNAFYSTVAIMQTEGFDAREIKKRHPEVYADGSKGGERGRNVHICHVETALYGYEPPAGDAVHFVFRATPRLVSSEPITPGRADLVFRGQYYFHIQLHGKNVHALTFCEQHLAELSKFHAQATKT